MDIQLLAIAAAIILVVVLLVSCFLLVGTRERTFEDALAEQQGLNLLLKDVGGDRKPHKDAKKKKHATAKEPPKKEKKVVDDQPSQQSSKRKDATPLSDTPTPSASLDGDEISGAVVADEESSNQQQDQTAASKAKQQAKKQKKEKLQKKRTISSEEADANNADVAAVADDSSLADARHRADAEEHPQDPAVDSADFNATEIVRDDPLLNRDDQAAPKKPKKKSSKAKGGETVEKVESKYEEQTFVEDTSLNGLLEKLHLPKLSDTQLEAVSSFYVKSEWSTAHSKPDPVAALKKQLDEKESLLNQEVQLASVANQQLKSLKLELTNEKQKHASEERSLKEQLVAKQNESLNVGQKLRELQNQTTSKIQAYRQMEAQLVQYRSIIEQTNPAQMQQLREENQRLKERHEQETLARNSDVQRLKQEILNRDTQVHRLEQQKQEMDQRCIHLEHRANAGQHFADSQAKLMQKEKECTQLTDELNKLRQEWSLLEQNVQVLRQQLTAEHDVAKVQTLQYQHQQAPPAPDHHSQQELDKLRTDLGKSNARSTDLEKQLADLKARVHDQDVHHGHALSQKENELKRLSDDVNILKKENDNLADQKNKAEDTRYKELENTRNAKNKLEAELQNIRSELESTKRKMHDHESVEKGLRSELQNSVLALKAAEAELENLKLDNQKSSDADYYEMQQNISVLESTIVGRDNTVTKLQEQLRELQRKCDDYDAQVRAMQKRADELSNENNLQQQRYLSENAKLLDQIRVQQAVNGHSEVGGVIIDPDVLKVNERSMTQLNKQLINKDCEIAHLKEQLEILRQKNIELRDKKYKAVESVQQMEKNAKELIDKIEDKTKKELRENERFIMEELSKRLPGCPYKEKETFREWLHQYERVVKSVMEKPVLVEPPIVVKHQTHVPPDAGEFKRKIDGLSKENDHLNEQLVSYKSVLAQTENLLRELERSAVDHEQKWNKKCSKLESEIAEARQQSTSRTVETSKQQQDAVHAEVHELRTKWEKERTEREILVKELTARQNELDSERAIYRDLSSQVVKLRGMLKTGQDALKHEQDLVSQLQTQLKSLQEKENRVSSLVMPKDDKGGRSIHDELEELRKRLSQRESQLEKEMIINKQLNNKLASLGVTAPSFSS